MFSPIIGGEMEINIFDKVFPKESSSLHDLAFKK
jgi:hypothetical protein